MMLGVKLQGFGCLSPQEVFKSRGFNEMSEEAVAFVLQSDRLRMDEADILEKVTEWATVNSVSLRRGRGTDPLLWLNE